MNDYSKYDPFSDNYDPSLKSKVITITVCEDCKSINDGWIIDKVIEMLDGRKLICLVIHGSKLYGLDHKDSDLDIKGVFLPSERDMFLGNIPETLKFSSGEDNLKNSKDDVDIELYSLQHFFKLSSNGDTGTISMLNAPFTMVCCQHDIWSKKIIPNREMFYSKNMEGLIGFVRTQADKYSIKGARLNAANCAKHFLSYHQPYTKLIEIWESIPEELHMDKIKINDQVFWEVCGRKIQNTANVNYAEGVINSIIKSYGKRAKQASADGGLDWKAISHAFRVASELSDLFEFGNIRYPLEDFARIKRMKMGELDFKSEVLPDLNSLMDRVHEKSQSSCFPDQIDHVKINDFLYELLKTIT